MKVIKMAEVNISAHTKIFRGLAALSIGLSALAGGGASAKDAVPSCAHLAADGLRQNANLLLFLVDAHLVARSIVMDMPGKVGALASAETFETHDADGNAAHWVYLSIPQETSEYVAPAANSTPALQLTFDQHGQLNDLQQRETPCTGSKTNPTEAETLALLAQKQRLDAAILIGQRCDCITYKSLGALADWAQAKTLDLPRSTMNLFQPYVALGPDVRLISESVIQITPVPRGSNTLGHMPVDELKDRLILGVETPAKTRLVRTIPYYQR